MPMIRKFLLFIFVAFITTSTLAFVTESDCDNAATNSCPAGCKVGLNGCFQCTGNTYSDKQNSSTCTLCSSATTTKHPFAPDGATSINECYMNCKFEITGGQYTANAKAYYPNACTYKVQDFTCDTGYAKKPTMKDTDPVTDANKDNICINKIECYKLHKNCDAGKVWGWAQFIDDKWSYSDCRCRLTDQTIDNGTGICGYHYKSGTGDQTEWETTCTPEKVTECDAGYCKANENTPECKPAPNGYYSPAKSTTCEKCPIGSTTDGSAEDITKCYITPNSTKNTTYFRNAQ